jgi:predicted MFS family arabinose efflux permease
MIGIVTTGIGFGSLIYSPLIGRLIFNYGWRQTYVIVGITVLVIVLPLSLILKRPETPNINDHKQNKPTSSPPAGNEDFTYREAVRTRQFWMLVIIYFFSGLGQFGLMVHIVPYATGQGISPVSAASIVSVIGGASIFGRLIIGGIGDKVKVKPLLTGISVVLAISLIWLELAREMPEFIAIGIIFGLGYGGFSTLQSLVAVEMFGLSTLGVILGNFIFSVCIGGSLGPVITGFVFDRTSSYPTAFLPGTITSVISLIMVFWLSHPKRRIT